MKTKVQKVIDGLQALQISKQTAHCALVRFWECSAATLRTQLDLDNEWHVVQLTDFPDTLLSTMDFLDYTQHEIERAKCAASTLGFAILTVQKTSGSITDADTGLLKLITQSVQARVPAFVRLGHLDDHTLGLVYPHVNALRLQALLEHVFDDVRAQCAEEPANQLAAGLTLFSPSDPDAAAVYNATNLLLRARTALERTPNVGGIQFFRSGKKENPTLVEAAEKQFLFFGKVSNG